MGNTLTSDIKKLNKDLCVLIVQKLIFCVYLQNCFLEKILFTRQNNFQLFIGVLIFT